MPLNDLPQSPGDVVQDPEHKSIDPSLCFEADAVRYINAAIHFVGIVEFGSVVFQGNRGVDGQSSFASFPMQLRCATWYMLDLCENPSTQRLGS